MSNVKHLDRRGFLKGAATGAVAGATTLVTAPLISATPAEAATPKVDPAGLSSPAVQAAMAAETAPLPSEEGFVVNDPGSDFMVDVLKTLDFEYIAANPAS